LLNFINISGPYYSTIHSKLRNGQTGHSGQWAFGVRGGLRVFYRKDLVLLQEFSTGCYNRCV